MWERRRHRLTKDQRERGVIFASRLDRDGCEGTMHEVTEDMSNKEDRINNLSNTSVFKSMARQHEYDVVEHIWKG